MTKVINGKTYYYVDTVVIDEMVYDVYEDEYDHAYYHFVKSLW